MYEKDFNKSKMINIRKKHSPVWEFAEKLNADQIQCKLCSVIFRSKGGNTTGILNHVSYYLYMHTFIGAFAHGIFLRQPTQGSY